MNVFKVLYKYIFKPIAFRFDPEFVHDRVLSLGVFLGKTDFGKAVVCRLFKYSSPMLEQTLAGIHFSNPIGLAAGFDKDAQLIEILPEVGFGFAELGSVTGEACLGNPKLRLWRLPKSRSLLVYYGLKNEGAEKISKRIKNLVFRIPMGISVAKTNSWNTVSQAGGVNDYVKAFRAFTEIGSYITVNISCPNTFGGQPFTDPESLEVLLLELSKIPISKPVFVKFSPDLSLKTVDALLEVISRYKIQGIICANLTKNRDNKNILETGLPLAGGFSGKVVEKLADELIAYVYKKTKGKYVVVGCGGVFSAEDAYKKIRLGASLVQLITGMIYEGPQVVGEINAGLVKLLLRDGFKNISEAVGVDSR